MNIFRESFVKLRHSRSIKLVDLQKLTGLRHNTLSGWLHDKHDLSTNNLSLLLIAAEKLSPGSITEFCFHLSGGIQSDDQLADMLLLLASEYHRIKQDKQSCQTTNTTTNTTTKETISV